MPDDVRVFDVHEQELDDGVRAAQPGHSQQKFHVLRGKERRARAGGVAQPVQGEGGHGERRRSSVI